MINKIKCLFGIHNFTDYIQKSETVQVRNCVNCGKKTYIVRTDKHVTTFRKHNGEWVEYGKMYVYKQTNKL